MKQVHEEVISTLRQQHIKDKGEITFTLREQDISMPKTIAYWILENIETAPIAKLIDALEKAIIAREFKNRKHAD